jgi:hypothetical protein
VASIVTFAAGLAWDPQIRGILAVLVGFVVLAGSVYLLLTTNLGSRLGFLLALAGLFGWMTILTLYWWVNPPGIGPAGDPPFWEVSEIHVTGGDEPPLLREAQLLPAPGTRVTPEQVLNDAPEVADQVGEDAALSDIAGVAPELLPRDDFGGWSVTSTADAGEAQAAADVALVDQGVFASAADLEHSSVFQIGGKPKVTETCNEDDAFFIYYACRAWFRVTEPLKTHPPHYAVVEVQSVIPQEPVPGQPPPRPIVDDTQPAIWVIMERQLATTRVLPFTYFIVSLAGFIIFSVMLHYRDKTLKRNVEQADLVSTGA